VDPLHGDDQNSEHRAVEMSAFTIRGVPLVLPTSRDRDPPLPAPFVVAAPIPDSGFAIRNPPLNLKPSTFHPQHSPCSIAH
jgi:hypothetical protein